MTNIRLELSGLSGTGASQRAHRPDSGDDAAAGFGTVEQAIEDIRAGRFVVVVDDPGRKNEGDLMIAAEHCTPEAVNFMVTHGRGLVCVCLSGDRCDELGLDPMTEHNQARFGTAFMGSIEARHGVTTGISAADRSRTIRTAADPAHGQTSFVQPGHIFPLQARPAGVLERAGHTEAAVDLARLAGLQPAGAVCEIMHPNGSMARVPDLISFCEEHGLTMVTVADLISYRRRHESLVDRVVAARLPTPYGEFQAVAFQERLTTKHHVALVMGDVRGKEEVLVRVHSECLTGDMFHSLRCACGNQLDQALSRIGLAGEGVLLYMAPEGRGTGLVNKLRRYKLQEQGRNTMDANLGFGIPADARDDGIVGEILNNLGLSTIRLLTNDPGETARIENHGPCVVGCLPLEADFNQEDGPLSSPVGIPNR